MVRLKERKVMHFLLVKEHFITGSVYAFSQDNFAGVVFLDDDNERSFQQHTKYKIRMGKESVPTTLTLKDK